MCLAVDGVALISQTVSVVVGGRGIRVIQLLPILGIVHLRLVLSLSIHCKTGIRSRRDR